MDCSSFCDMQSRPLAIYKLYIKICDSDKYATMMKSDDLRTKYLTGFGLMCIGDWLQGPYVYALYQQYEIPRRWIGLLFVAGFAASMLFGTTLGSLADVWGRKLFVQLYAFVYILACWIKHSSNIGWLFVGRILGGISTSLLMSVFESWLINEHSKQNMSTEYLKQILSEAGTINSLCAIASGVLAEGARRLVPERKFGQFYFGGFVAPFDLAILFLTAGIVYVQNNWEENVGMQTIPSLKDQLYSLCSMKEYRHRNVLVLGLIQSFFESAMYIFVFAWTPILSRVQPDIPHGMIFSLFMIASMLGSQLFARTHREPEQILTWAFLVAMFTLLVFPLCKMLDLSQGIPTFVSFLVFEFCVGVYFPTIAFLKSKNVPETNRSETYNKFRVLLNLLVILVFIANPSLETTIVISACFVYVAYMLSLYIQEWKPSASLDKTKI